VRLAGHKESSFQDHSTHKYDRFHRPTIRDNVDRL
jgi:hypothetical protein